MRFLYVNRLRLLLRFRPRNAFLRGRLQRALLLWRAPLLLLGRYCCFRGLRRFDDFDGRHLIMTALFFLITRSPPRFAASAFRLPPLFPRPLPLFFPVVSFVSVFAAE